MKKTRERQALPGNQMKNDELTPEEIWNKYKNLVTYLINKRVSRNKSLDGDLFQDYQNEICLALLEYLAGNVTWRVRKYIKVNKLGYGDNLVAEKVIKNAINSHSYYRKKIREGEVSNHELALNKSDNELIKYYQNKNRMEDFLDDVSNNLTEPSSTMLDICRKNNPRNPNELAEICDLKRSKIYVRLRKLKDEVKTLKKGDENGDNI